MWESDRRRHLAYEVVRLRNAGRSQREISRALQIARKTVKRILQDIEERRAEGESAVERARGRPRVPKGSKLDAFDEKLRAWLDEYPDMTAVRCWEKLTEEEHVVVGYTIVRERLKRLRGEVEPKAPAVPMELAPGQRSEFDWSPYKLANGDIFNTWRNTLCWSRAMHMAGATDTKQTTILANLRLDFEHWGGVPHECMTDSMPGVVDRWECERPILNARYVDFVAHYGYTALIAPRACPKGKPFVERGFWFHECNLLNARTITSFEQYCSIPPQHLRGPRECCSPVCSLRGFREALRCRADARRSGAWTCARLPRGRRDHEFHQDVEFHEESRIWFVEFERFE
jgi:transposase